MPRIENGEVKLTVQEWADLGEQMRALRNQVNQLAPAKPLKSVAFDCSDWHNGQGCERTFVSGYGGIGVKICCRTCGVLCDVEALGTRIPVEETYMQEEGHNAHP